MLVGELGMSFDLRSVLVYVFASFVSFAVKLFFFFWSDEYERKI